MTTCVNICMLALLKTKDMHGACFRTVTADFKFLNIGDKWPYILVDLFKTNNNHICSHDYG